MGRSTLEVKLINGRKGDLYCIDNGRHLDEACGDCQITEFMPLESEEAREETEAVIRPKTHCISYVRKCFCSVHLPLIHLPLGIIVLVPRSRLTPTNTNRPRHHQLFATVPVTNFLLQSYPLSPTTKTSEDGCSIRLCARPARAH